MEQAVIAEPEVVENNSEVETNQLPDVGQSNTLQSGETLVPNVSSDVASTGDVSMTATNENLSENTSNEDREGCSQGADLDQVSSSTETSVGQCRDALPSVSHQMVVIPNMEPYLEDGSLDGTPKELQDPTSSNGNLLTEDTSNPEPELNHVASPEPDIHTLHENGEEQLDLVSETCHTEEQPGEVVLSEVIEETPNDEATAEGDQVASCSDQLIEESTTAVCDGTAAVTDSEHYQTAILPITSEEVVPEDENVHPQSGTANVEPVMGEAEQIGQFESLQANVSHFTADGTCMEGDVASADQTLVTSLSTTEMTSHSEVSESGTVFMTANEASNETEQEENGPESACELVETNESVGEAAIFRNDFADSSTLEMEEGELVATEPDDSMIPQEDLQSMSYQEPTESSPIDESGQQDSFSGRTPPETETVDSSVDHTVQAQTGHIPEEGTLNAEDYQRECAEVEPIIDANLGIDQVDSGTAQSDFVDDGVAESGLADEEAMETGQILSGTADNDFVTVAADPVNEESGESTGSQSIIPDNAVATTEGEVSYDDPVGSGTIEEEANDAQSIETHLIAAHPMETQPVENIEPQTVDEGVDSSYYMNSAHIEQPDGTIAESVDASTDIDNPTSSHLDQHFENNEVDNPELINMDTNLSNPTAVCEADSSAVGMEDSAYETQQMVDTQNVYVVEDDGRLTLNSVEPSNSMNSYHNPENAMLVEMAPLSTDGSYVDSQVCIIVSYRIDTELFSPQFKLSNR